MRSVDLAGYETPVNREALEHLLERYDRLTAVPEGSTFWALNRVDHRAPSSGAKPQRVRRRLR